MSHSHEFSTGAATGARIEKPSGEKWTLILVREVRHPRERVWQALTDPAELREWAPYEVDGDLGRVGATVMLTWVGTPTPVPTAVTRAERPSALEYGDMRWQLESIDGGTRLTLWSTIDRRFIAWGAAGWHIALDVLGQRLAGTPVGRIAGSEAMKLTAWQRLRDEYSKQFGI